MLRLGLGLGVQKAAIISEAAPPDETDPPVNTALPIITGSPVVGMTLSVSDGTWDNEPASFAYQWKADGVAIDSATASTYQLTEDELDAEITCTVTAINAGGSAEATAETLMEWVSSWGITTTSDSAGWNGYTARAMVLAAGLLHGGTKVRVTMEGGSAAQAVIDACYIGHGAASGDIYDFDGNQVPLTVGGSAGFTLTAGAQVVSDEIEFTLDPAKDFIVSMHFSALSTIRQALDTNARGYYKAAVNEAGTTNVSAYSQALAAVYAVSNVEVYRPATVRMTDFAAATVDLVQKVNVTGNIEVATTILNKRTPRGAITFNRRTAATHKSESTDFNMSFGFADADGNEFSALAASADGATSSSGIHGKNASKADCVFQATSAGGIAEEGHLDAMIENGIRINITDAGPGLYKNPFLLLAGDDIDIKVGSFNPTTGGASVDVGFEPDAIILLSHNAAANESAVTTSSQLSLGFAAWDSGGTKTEACAATAKDTGSTRLYRGVIANDACGVQASSTSDVLDYKVNLTRTSTGFTAASTADASTDEFGYMAIKFNGGAQAKVGTWALPTSTGAQSKTGVGFKPKLVLLAGTDLTAAGVGSSGLLAWAAMSEAYGRNGGTHSIAGSRVSDGAASGASFPTDERTVTDNDGIYGMLPAGTADYDIDFTSFDNDGWTVNVVNAPAAAYLWNYLAIG